MDELKISQTSRGDVEAIIHALGDVGQVHYKTDELLAATWQPGDERILLSLAAEPELPPKK